MENLKMEMGYICDAIKSEDYHTAEDLIILIQELEKLAYATNQKGERHAICHVKRVQYSGDIIKLKTSRTGRYTNVKQTIVSQLVKVCRYLY